MTVRYDTAIVGAGYVGLTLAIYMSMKGSKIILIDNDIEKINQLNEGKSPIFESGLNYEFKKCIDEGNLKFTSETDVLCTNWIIAISYFPGDVQKYIDVLKIIKTYNDKPPSIMIRGTVPLGYTRNYLLPELEKKFDGKLDEKFYLTTAPERTLSGDALNELEELPQLIGGSDTSEKKCEKVYNNVGINCIKLGSLETGELAKTFTNFARLVQFNLSNYLGSLCYANDINDKKIFNSLKQGYPRLNFLSEIGPGVGGFCLPKDSLVLHDAFTNVENKLPSDLYSFPKDQYDLNQKIISHHFEIVRELTSKSKKTLALGVAFKGTPPTDDTRDSTGLTIVKRLLNENVDLEVYDRTVSENDRDKLGLPRSSIGDENVVYDTLLILNNDPEYKNFVREHMKNFDNKIKLYDPWRIIVGMDNLIIQQNYILDSINQMRS